MPLPDWGEIFTFFATSTNITRNEIPMLTYPQVKAYMTKAGKYISPFWGGAGEGGNATSTVDIENAPERTVEDTKQFVTLFQGLG